jgi:putative DNA methylase
MVHDLAAKKEIQSEHQLTPILHSWKSFTAHEFNRILVLSGRIWRPESFDHIVRSSEHLAKFEAYIRNNARPLG